MQLAKKEDIFDRIKLDIFDSIEPKILKDYVAPPPIPKVSLSLSEEIRSLIKSEIGALVKQAVAEAVKGVEPRTVETKTIERIVEKSIPTPERIIEKVDDIELQKRIDKKIKRAMDDSVFIPAPPIIPNWSDKADGVVLSKKASQLQWVAAATGSGGTSSDVYTPSSVTTLRTFDATNTSLDELANALGSLIVSLQGAGIIK